MQQRGVRPGCILFRPLDRHEYGRQVSEWHRCARSRAGLVVLERIVDLRGRDRGVGAPRHSWEDGRAAVRRPGETGWGRDSAIARRACSSGASVGGLSRVAKSRLPVAAHVRRA